MSPPTSGPPRRAAAARDRGRADQHGRDQRDRRVFTDPDGAPLPERGLERRCARGAARAGIALPGRSFGNGSITDLRGLPRIGP
ncbi:hypothetical protein [Pseudonocardia asaccharolytica]|uniref:Uncharacterized protein n=1 Tax=Pseudonocardia asaccharolytica DSM 44247 = NBRC 16224 TaxID=1123024 RepID=A0A511D767_9PSEU|nr:hypothetical protein [Pseudonocardia asaccharolytica]GEL20651.1 hypothetical protein PA7_44880 [Pseudonocardia asaccharolytica DSM 44247 = NBRC 16224]